MTSETTIPLATPTLQPPILKIKALHQGLIPQYATSGAAGADLKAHLPEALNLLPQQSALIPTGIFLEIPHGWEVQIRPRSGLALKYGITILNTPGTIDSDYRGQVQVILINLGKEPFLVEPNMRIAQMVVAQAPQASFFGVDDISATSRGAGGFGHTGVHTHTK